MKAYVVNLPSDVERRRAMQRELDASPFAGAEFVEAVDGRRMSDSQLAEAFDFSAYGRRRVGRPQPGEVGCVLSHRLLWQRIADADEVGVVFEDDIAFDGDWSDVLSFARTWLADNAPRALLLPRHFFYTRFNPAVGGGRVARPIQGFGTECYMLNPSGARLLLSLGRPSFIADEWDYFRSCGLELLAFVPHPVAVNARFDSNIASRHDWQYDYDGAVRAVSNYPCLFEYTRILNRMILRRLHLLNIYHKAPVIR